MNRIIVATLALFAVHCGGATDAIAPIDSGIWCDPEPDSCGSLGGQLCSSPNASDQPVNAVSVGVYDAGSVGPFYWCQGNSDPCQIDNISPPGCHHVPFGETSACGSPLTPQTLLCCCSE